jgi:hypothetical protein
MWSLELLPSPNAAYGNEPLFPRMKFLSLEDYEKACHDSFASLRSFESNKLPQFSCSIPQALGVFFFNGVFCKHGQLGLFQPSS